MMKAANLATSPRLQRVADLLADGCEHTTMEIIEAAKVCAVNSIIAELRANGLEILCRRCGDVWVYWQPSQDTKAQRAANAKAQGGEPLCGEASPGATGCAAGATKKGTDMACPKCGCKTVYQYDDEDEPQDDRLQRCAACGEVFDIDDHTEEDDDDQ